MEPFEADGAGIDVEMVLKQKDIQGLGPDLLAGAEESGQRSVKDEVVL